MVDYDKVNREVADVLNRMIANDPALSSLFPQSANYYYYSRKGSKDEYFYTVNKINHKGHLRYVAGIYRYLKTRKALKLVRSAGFSKKKTAMSRAQMWRDQAK